MNNELPKQLIYQLLDCFDDNPQLKQLTAYKDMMQILLLKPRIQITRYLEQNVPRTAVSMGDYQDYADRLYKQRLVDYMRAMTDALLTAGELSSDTGSPFIAGLPVERNNLCLRCFVEHHLKTSNVMYEELLDYNENYLTETQVKSYGQWTKKCSLCCFHAWEMILV